MKAWLKVRFEEFVVLLLFLLLLFYSLLWLTLELDDWFYLLSVVVLFYEVLEVLFSTSLEDTSHLMLCAEWSFSSMVRSAYEMQDMSLNRESLISPSLAPSP